MNKDLSIKKIDLVEFVNGYRKDSRKIVAKCLGVEINESKGVFLIFIGERIL